NTIPGTPTAGPGWTKSKRKGGERVGAGCRNAQAVKPIRVDVAGASGRMGREVVRMLVREAAFEFVRCISRSQAGKEVGEGSGVACAGARGRMVREVDRTLVREEAFECVRGISRSQGGEDVGEVTGLGPLGVTFSDSLDTALLEARPDVLVDFTVPAVVKRHV